MFEFSNNKNDSFCIRPRNFKCFWIVRRHTLSISAKHFSMACKFLQVDVVVTHGSVYSFVCSVLVLGQQSFAKSLGSIKLVTTIARLESEAWNKLQSCRCVDGPYFCFIVATPAH